MIEIFKVVAGRAMIYEMEVYCPRKEGMNKRVQIWVNRSIRGIFGGVRTTSVDMLLGEVGIKGWNIS